LAEEKEETGEAEKQNEPQGEANPCAVSLNCGLSILRPNVECANASYANTQDITLILIQNISSKYLFRANILTKHWKFKMAL